MGDFRLNTFADGSLIADLVTGSGRITVKLIGEARYEISAVCDSGRLIGVELWTTKKGIITTCLRVVAAWATLRLGSDGNLRELNASDCSLHLEHRDRGHYWLGLEGTGGDTIHVEFTTPGHLKTRVTQDAVPTVAN